MPKIKHLNPLDSLLEQKLPGPGPLRARLAIERLRRLSGTLRLAATESAFYRKLAQAELIAGADKLERAVGSAVPMAKAEELILEVLATLPFTWPSDIAKSPESFMAVSQDEVEGLVSVPSSGSLGQAKRIFSTAGDQDSTIEFFRHGMLSLVSPGARDKVALAMSGTRPGTTGDLLARAMAFHSIKCKVMGYLPEGKKEVTKWRKRLTEFAPTALVGLPSQLAYLARTQKKTNSLKTVLLSGESAPKALIKAIESAWGVKVFVHYGMTEFGLGGAVECLERQGPHLREADLACEIVGSQSQLAHGRPGEITLTSLTRKAMPLIRYRTGDLGLLDPSPCKCGSVLRRLRVGCREANLAPLGNGQAISLEDLVEALFPLNYVASVAATAFAPPQTGLALAIGTNARATGKMASEIREALATMTRGNDGTISVKLVEGPATPAIGGAKPTVARPGRRPDAGGQAENAN